MKKAHNQEQPNSPRRSSRFLKRFILSSDEHWFVGRIYELGIVGQRFSTYEEAAQYPDVKYALDVSYAVTLLTRRVETLNVVGDMLWPEPVPRNFQDFPVSRYHWLMIATDLFLVRYASVLDCALLLTSTVFELDLKPEECRLNKLEKLGASPAVIAVMADMKDDQGALRIERNARVHHGLERAFSNSWQSFETTSLFEHWNGKVLGTDEHGQKINIVRSFKEGLVELQRDFNPTARRLCKTLDRLYDVLGNEFEDRFGPRIAAATHGLNANTGNRR
ncbi:MAG: hypothetical protein KUG65_09770 [Sphingomonadaceae bacterium]|nr:hypothetical protein [Sphingomonadaceae bacterium]